MHQIAALNFFLEVRSMLTALAFSPQKGLEQGAELLISIWLI